MDEPLDKKGPLDVEADVVLDAVGGDAALAAPKGARVITVSSSSVAPLQDAGFDAAAILVEPDRAGLEGLLAAGVRAHVEAIFPLEHAADAHRLGEQGRTRGKIVLSL